MTLSNMLPVRNDVAQHKTVCYSVVHSDEQVAADYFTCVEDGRTKLDGTEGSLKTLDVSSIHSTVLGSYFLPLSKMLMTIFFM